MLPELKKIRRGADIESDKDVSELFWDMIIVGNAEFCKVVFQPILTSLKVMQAKDGFEEADEQDGIEDEEDFEERDHPLIPFDGVAPTIEGTCDGDKVRRLIPKFLKGYTKKYRRNFYPEEEGQCANP